MSRMEIQGSIPDNLRNALGDAMQELQNATSMSYQEFVYGVPEEAEDYDCFGIQLNIGEFSIPPTIKLKIYQEDGKKEPHIHIDLHDMKHAATFSIETADLITGNLSISRKYIKAIRKWIINNKNLLKGLWSALQSGSPTSEFNAILHVNKARS